VNARLDNENEIPGVVPVPESVTLWGLPLALSVKFNDAARSAVAEGVKVTLTAQVFPCVTVAPVQVSADFAKSPAFVPPRRADAMVRFAVPELVMVTVMGLLVVLTCWPLKLSVELDGENAGAVPVPVRLTDCGLPVALSVKLKEALRVPMAAGVKVTLTPQLLPGVTFAPVQESALLVKSPAFEPPSATVEMERVAVPVLVTVRLKGPLVVFTN
jgi:hypothetical protein